MKAGLTLLLGLALLLTATHGNGQEAEGAESPLSFVALDVSPERPGLDTLCRLAVQLRNDSDRAISELAFQVRLNDQVVDVYESQLFYVPLPAQTTTRVDLFNFWTTETDRPAPSSGELTVTVSLEAARFVQIETSGEGSEAVETWTPLEAVAAMPAERSLVLELQEAR